MPRSPRALGVASELVGAAISALGIMGVGRWRDDAALVGLGIVAVGVGALVTRRRIPPRAIGGVMLAIVLVLAPSYPIGIPLPALLALVALAARTPPTVAASPGPLEDLGAPFEDVPAPMRTPLAAPRFPRVAG